MDSPSPPAAPDPVQTAAAQTASNKETAIANAHLNRVDQTSPFGSSKYTINGYNEDGTPKYSQETTLSPELQGIYKNYTDMTQGMGDIGNSQLAGLQEQYAQPFDLNAEAGKKIADMQHQYMDPVWQRRQEQADNALIQRGFSVGDKGYSRGMQDFADQREKAYLGADLGAWQQGQQSAIAQRQLPLNEFNAMRTGSQVQQPTFAGVPGATQANTDVAGITQAGFQNQMGIYNQEVAQNNALMGGLFGLGGAGLGMFKFGSDRRLKKDIKLIGEGPRGLGRYEYTYVWGGPRYIGYMADEVLEVAPWAVSVMPNGFMAVDYSEVF